MPASLSDIAERYVHLVLAIGQHDPSYVDAYYGPPAVAAGRRRRPLLAAKISQDIAAALASSMAAQ